jgi:hypothetical protein
MKYLIRSKGKNKAAHYWKDGDTLCRMWSTGGIDKRRAYAVFENSQGLRICHMCGQVHEKSQQELINPL